jgi:hypothetical protein
MQGNSTGTQVNENAEKLYEHWGKSMRTVLPLPTVRVHIVLQWFDVGASAGDRGC